MIRAGSALQRPRTYLICYARQRRHYGVLDASRDALCAMHDVSHLPWAATIPLATALFSLATLPLAIRSRKAQITIAALQPLIDAETPIIARQLRKEKPDLAPAEADRELKQRINTYRRALRGRHGVGLGQVLALPAAKLPLWLLLSFTLRDMAGAALPSWLIGEGDRNIEQGFATEGFAHIADLTAPDPLVALPVLIGVLNLVNVEVSAAARSRAQPGAGLRVVKVVENMLRIVAMVFIPVAAQMPAAVCLYWTSSATLALAQNLALDRFIARPHVQAPVEQTDTEQKPRRRLILPDEQT